MKKFIDLVLTIGSGFAIGMAVGMVPSQDHEPLSESEVEYIQDCSLLQRTQQCVENVQRLRDLGVPVSPITSVPQDTVTH